MEDSEKHLLQEVVYIRARNIGVVECCIEYLFCE